MPDQRGAFWFLGNIDNILTPQYRTLRVSSYLESDLTRLTLVSSWTPVRPWWRFRA